MNEQKNWEKLYKIETKRLEEKIKEERNGAIIILVLMMIMFITTVLPLVDNVDVDDVLAPYLCKQHNLTLKEVTYKNAVIIEGEFDMKVICKKPTEQKPIEDGYLILEKEVN